MRGRGPAESDAAAPGPARQPGRLQRGSWRTPQFRPDVLWRFWTCEVGKASSSPQCDPHAVLTPVVPRGHTSYDLAACTCHAVSAGSEGRSGQLFVAKSFGCSGDQLLRLILQIASTS